MNSLKPSSNSFLRWDMCASVTPSCHAQQHRGEMVGPSCPLTVSANQREKLWIYGADSDAFTPTGSKKLLNQVKQINKPRTEVSSSWTRCVSSCCAMLRQLTVVSPLSLSLRFPSSWDVASSRIQTFHANASALSLHTGLISSEIMILRTSLVSALHSLLSAITKQIHPGTRWPPFVDVMLL